MVQSEQIEGVTIYEDEELLHHVKSNKVLEYVTPIHVILTVISFGFWLLFWIPWVAYKHYSGGSSTEYIITDERIVTKTGRLATSTEQVSFDNIVGDIRTDQNIAQSIVNAGDVEFNIQKTRETGGKSGEFGDRERSERDIEFDRNEMVLENINNHNEVADSIRRIHRQS